MSSNAITNNYGIDLPATQITEQDLVEERKAAKFSRTKEYQELKLHLEQRILFYQTFLPDGSQITARADMSEIGMKWAIANAIIAEFNAVLTAYENAREVVKNAR